MDNDKIEMEEVKIGCIHCGKSTPTIMPKIGELPRLRKENKKTFDDFSAQHKEDILKLIAKDKKIEELEAENDRLRSALEKIANINLDRPNEEMENLRRINNCVYIAKQALNTGQEEQ